jgi:hypothetical protein
MIWMEAQQDVAQIRVNAKTRVQEAEATIAGRRRAKLCTGERQLLPEPHAGFGLRSSVEGTAGGSCVALPDPSADF